MSQAGWYDHGEVRGKRWYFIVDTDHHYERENWPPKANAFAMEKPNFRKQNNFNDLLDESRWMMTS